MNIEDVREYALSLPGTTEDQAYGEDWVLFRIEGNSFLYYLKRIGVFLKQFSDGYI